LTWRFHYAIVAVIICKTIGGIVMSQSNLEKQEAKLKALNQKIKDEKNRIEQRLGKQIISQANLEYANLSNDQIKLLAQQFSEFLKEKSVDH
jgi:tetrahydromethanopterin S-methyltransferase subunit G